MNKDKRGRAALRGNALIFPSPKLTTPMSDIALSVSVRRVNAERRKATPAPCSDPDGRDAVTHGFRDSFSTWVDGTWPTEPKAVVDALTHKVQNKFSVAYLRSDLRDRRTPLMSEWAVHCTNPHGRSDGSERRRLTDPRRLHSSTWPSRPHHLEGEPPRTGRRGVRCRIPPS